MMSEVVPMRREPSLKIAAGLSLPLDAVTQTFAILARKGAGKTYTGLVMVEEMVAAGLRVVVLDPLGAAWGLRAAANGRDDGLPVTILGGEHGDLPLEPTAGRVVADLVVSHDGSFVLDLSGFESNAAQDRFVADFAERLYRAKTEDRRPLHLLIDEADSFAPQRPMPGQQRMLGALEAIVRRGRIRGLGVTLITQRPAVLNKNVLTQAECLITLQMTAPQDRAAIDEWVRGNGTKEQRDELVASLASLQRGQAWFWSPSWLQTFTRVQVRKRTTFDSSKTPEAGVAVIEPKRLAPVQIEALRSQMAATIEKAKADDPRELRRQLAEKDRELTRMQRIAVTAAVDGQTLGAALAKDVPVLTDADRELLAKQRTCLEQMAGKLGVIEEEIIGKAVDRMAAAAAHVVTDAKAEIESRRAAFLNAIEQAKFCTVLDKIATAVPAQSHRHASHVARTALEVRDHGPRPSMRVSRPASSGSAAASLPKGEVATLTVAAQYPDGATREQITILTGYKRSTRDAYIQRLRERGLVELSGPLVNVTQAGVDALGSDFEPLPTGEALRRYWLDRLPEGERRVLQVALNAYPAPVPRESIDAQTDFKRSTRDAYIQRLGTRKLITIGRGEVRASETLFG